MSKFHTICSALFTACVATAYCGGLTEADLVNTQQLELKNVSSVKIAYSSDDVRLFRGDSDLLVIKEYMSIDNSKYYAHISYATDSNAEKQLVVKNGRRPLVVVGFQSRVEVYIPASFSRTVAVKTSSGSIRSDDALSFSTISLESSSGSITVNDIKSDTTAVVKTSSGSIRLQEIAANDIQFSSSSGSIRCGVASGNTAIDTSSGSIDVERVNGDVIAGSSSGSIDLKMVTGALKVKTTSGSIRCAVAESAGDIALNASSGSVTLNVPKDLGFRFFSKMTSGSLSTPFSKQLYAPISDRHSATGIIGADGVAENELISINIKTSSGSIRVQWI